MHRKLQKRTIKTTVTLDNTAPRKILLMCKNYYIKNNLLYKVSLPRTKKQQKVRPQNYLLCIPAKHTANLLHEWHAILGHYGPNRLLPCLNTRFYWPKLLVDVKNIFMECEICQQSKIITNPRTAPLSPISVPKRGFSLVSMDHKKLTRTTEQGNNFILVFVDYFSKWTRYVLVQDESAYTTARVFVAKIIASFGRVEFLLSDKGPGSMSAFFAVISKILGVKHKTSASLAKRTNGLAERQIRALN